MTSAQLYNNFVDPKPLPSGFSSNIVDVRDVAAAHVLALERPEAGGERFITSRGPFDFTELRAFFTLSLVLLTLLTHGYGADCGSLCTGR